MCDETLKDWLAKHQKLTTDDLEALLGFSLNIARGVEHLHSQKVGHAATHFAYYLFKKSGAVTYYILTCDHCTYHY